MKSILIVDDNPRIRGLLRTLLEKQRGWAVCGEANNGLEAIDKAQQLLPDLIVLDQSMPVMNGLQAGRRLREFMPSVRLVMFTNFTSPYLEAEALSAGIDTVRDKSEFATLITGIQQLLKAA